MGYVLIAGWAGLYIGIAFGVVAMVLLGVSDRNDLPDSRQSGR